MKTFTAKALDEGTLTFYAEDSSGELVPYLGHLRSLPDVSSLRHIGSRNGAEMLRAHPPKYVVIEGKRRDVLTFIARCVDDPHRPRMIIKGGYQHDESYRFETDQIIDSPPFAVNVVRMKRGGGDVYEHEAEK